MIVENKNIYAKEFNKDSPCWTEDRELNFMYLKAAERYYNDLLMARGYVFLRDIYERLGIHISKESIFVGWYYKPNNSRNNNYIDFNINGEGPNFMLNFNVDGDITNNF